MPGPDVAGGPVYRLADYLDQHRRRTVPPIPPRSSRPPPWPRPADDQAALGEAADARGLYRDATQLYKNAAAPGTPALSAYLNRAAGLTALIPAPPDWAVTHAVLDNPRDVGHLLDRLGKAARTSRSPRCWP